jgi:DNA-binding GntR family transcriptional regulator
VREVDHGSHIPVYVQLADILRERIAAGEWSHGPMPSVRQLSQEYDVGRDTAVRAIEVLRNEGTVFTVSKRGTYVTPRS